MFGRDIYNFVNRLILGRRNIFFISVLILFMFHLHYISKKRTLPDFGELIKPVAYVIICPWVGLIITGLP